MPSSQETEREARIWPPSPKSKGRGYERRRVKGILEVLDKIDSRKEPQPTGRPETFHKPRTGNASCLGGGGRLAGLPDSSHRGSSFVPCGSPPVSLGYLPEPMVFSSSSGQAPPVVFTTEPAQWEGKIIPMRLPGDGLFLEQANEICQPRT
jgi:hypothetical protein